ncbi:methylenetetrahydrofolate reductase [Buchnera aphidicola]|uniref:methylenetetrahydrofolate reductase n=1 Tax=Buchnera aphidicola TaxID=9 RepID=UPI0034643BCE
MNIDNQYYDIINQDIFNINANINLSFEFFPPKNTVSSNNFFTAIEKLSIFHPKFISVTCTAEKNIHCDYTYNAIKKIPKILQLNIAPHITYINSSISEIKTLAKNYWNAGIRSIVALRGDVKDSYPKSPKVYAYELVSLLKDVADFDISVAAYPEAHPESKSAKHDLMYLKKKIDSGANRAITQFFFDANQYLRFRDQCFGAGIYVDIIPGILPIINFKQLKRFIKLTNVSIPKWMENIFNNLIDDPYINKMVGLIISVNIIKKLCEEGVNNFHFYTLNHFDMVYSLCSILKNPI